MKSLSMKRLQRDQVQLKLAIKRNQRKINSRIRGRHYILSSSEKRKRK